MRPIRAATRVLVSALVALAPLAAQAQADRQPSALGLMGTIPIFWGEADGVADLIDGSAKEHWARPLLAASHDLKPLDYLNSATLGGLRLLLIAQPRALSGEENVALDGWVRTGGRLLLFADPMMTGHSRFALGDRRRPQDIVLLSPILARWGLKLEYLEGQQPVAHLVGAGGIALPVNLPGRLVPTGSDSECSLSGDGILAQCRIGQGRATIMADAMLLDLDQPDQAASEALGALLALTFEQSGEIRGN